MKTSKDKGLEKIIGISGLLLIVAFLTYVLLPVILGSAPPLPKNQLAAKMKQIGTGLMIYSLDHDGLLPNIQTRDQLKTVIEPYTKNRSLFEPVEKNYHLPIEFNANLAGVNIDLPQGIPLADKTNFLPPSQAVMLYAIITKKDESPAVLTHADISIKALPKGSTLNPADIFAPQFDRQN